MPTFYAISNITWATGPTPARAEENHHSRALAVRPSWVPEEVWGCRVDDSINRPEVYEAPGTAHGFTVEGPRVYWTDEHGEVLLEAVPV